MILRRDGARLYEWYMNIKQRMFLERSIVHAETPIHSQFVGMLMVLSMSTFIHTVMVPEASTAAKNSHQTSDWSPVSTAPKQAPTFLKLHYDAEKLGLHRIHTNAGASFEARPGTLHKLVFIRNPEYVSMQQLNIPSLSRPRQVWNTWSLDRTSRS